MALPEALPHFKYHPDPIATGSIVADSDAPCLCCNRIRGFVYDGPVYSEKFHHLEHCICPWCIADGSAAKKFRAVFTDAGTMEGVSVAVMDEVGERTPGYDAWQQEVWLTCCGDGAAFLGTAGAAEMKGQFAAAIPALKKYLREEYGMSGDELQECLDGLSKEEDPSAYVFQCLHCKKHLAYVDES